MSRSRSKYKRTSGLNPNQLNLLIYNRLTILGKSGQPEINKLKAMSRSRSKYKRKSGLKPKLAPIKPNWPTKGVKTLTPKRDKKSKNKKINQPAKLPPTETKLSPASIWGRRESQLLVIGRQQRRFQCTVSIDPSTGPDGGDSSRVVSSAVRFVLLLPS